MSDETAPNSRNSDALPVPQIEPVPLGIPRPFWSVMIPTYESSELLEETIRSVLEQDPGRDRMEIVVVDDCSKKSDSLGVVERLAPGRIRFHRHPVNLGLAGNWNSCIALGTGQWIHILHQDDQLLPGFYKAMERASGEHPEVGASFCQHVTADGSGNWEKLSALERRSPGVLDAQFIKMLASHQRIQCVSIVVRRSVYETLGGFHPKLKYALDWEMWLRIALRYPIWFEPTVLACWRKYEGNETSRLRKGGQIMIDIDKSIAIMRRYVPPDLVPVLGAGVYTTLRDEALASATDSLLAGDRRQGFAKVQEAIRYKRSLMFSNVVFQYYKWCLKLWIQELMGERPRPPHEYKAL